MQNNDQYCSPTHHNFVLRAQRRLCAGQFTSFSTDRIDTHVATPERVVVKRKENNQRRPDAGVGFPTLGRARSDQMGSGVACVRRPNGHQSLSLTSAPGHHPPPHRFCAHRADNMANRQRSLSMSDAVSPDDLMRLQLPARLAQAARAAEESHTYVQLTPPCAASHAHPSRTRVPAGWRPSSRHYPSSPRRT